MTDNIQIAQFISNKPGYLKKLEQIISSGILDVTSDVGEIHFDKDGNIRKIKVPKVIIYP
jgi:hypothetical protein